MLSKISRIITSQYKTNNEKLFKNRAVQKVVTILFSNTISFVLTRKLFQQLNNDEQFKF